MHRSATRGHVKDEVASELEVLEKLAETAQLTVVLGKTGVGYPD